MRLSLIDIESPADCARIADLQQSIWQCPIAGPMAPERLPDIIPSGGILIGAVRDSSRMVGFVASLPKSSGESRVQYSYMLGVLPEARAKGVGYALKMQQRERARALGATTIEWTYDPLLTVNAHLNIHKLGARVRRYVEQALAGSQSPLHAGTPTDRFVTEWDLEECDRPNARVGGPAGGASQLSARPVNQTIEDADIFISSEPNLALRDPRLSVAVPNKCPRLPDSSHALSWRLLTRRVFQHYFALGYEVVDFLRGPGSSTYVLQIRYGPTCSPTSTVNLRNFE